MGCTQSKEVVESTKRPQELSAPTITTHSDEVRPEQQSMFDDEEEKFKEEKIKLDKKQPPKASVHSNNKETNNKVITVQPHTGCVFKATIPSDGDETASSASRKIFINVFHHTTVLFESVHSLPPVEVEDKGGIAWPLYNTVISSKYFETSNFNSEKIAQLLSNYLQQKYPELDFHLWQLNRLKKQQGFMGATIPIFSFSSASASASPNSNNPQTPVKPPSSSQPQSADHSAASPAVMTSDSPFSALSFPDSSPDHAPPSHLESDVVSDLDDGDGEEGGGAGGAGGASLKIVHGWVRKKAEHLKDWRPRYLVLCQGYLLYFTQAVVFPGDAAAGEEKLPAKMPPVRGVICLAGMREKAQYEQYTNCDPTSSSSSPAVTTKQHTSPGQKGSAKTSPTSSPSHHSGSGGSGGAGSALNKLTDTLHALDDVTLVKGNASDPDGSHLRIHLFLVGTLLSDKTMDLLSPKRHTQRVTDLVIETSSTEEKQAWLQAFAAHTEHLEALARTPLTAFPAPLTAFQRQYEGLVRGERQAADVRVQRIGSALVASAGLAGGVLGRRASASFVGRRDSDASTSSSASYLTTNTTNTTSETTSPSSSPPLHSSSSASISSSASTSTFQRRGSTGSTGVLTRGASEMSSLGSKIPAKVQQHCQTDERIVLCGLVKAWNRVYLTVFRLLVLFETKGSDGGGGEDGVASAKRKRLVVLDSNSYAIKASVQWLCGGAVPTVTQNLDNSFDVLPSSADDGASGGDASQDNAQADASPQSSQISSSNSKKKMRFFPQDKISTSQWIEAILSQ